MIATNGSMQADAFLFQALVEPGDVVVVEAPTYDRTLLALRRWAPRCWRSRWRPTASTSTRSSRRSTGARGPSSPTSSPTSTTRPAARSRSKKRERLIELAAQARLRAVRGRPVRGAALRGRAAAHDALARRVATRSSTRRPSRRPSAPASGSGYLAGPETLIARDAQAGHRHLHLAEHGVPGDRRRVLRVRARSTARSRPSRRPCASAATPSAQALETELPEAEFVVPRGRLLPVGRPARGHRRRADRGAGRRARGGVREGHRLPAGGRRELAADRLLGRARGPDRRGRVARSPAPTGTDGAAA